MLTGEEKKTYQRDYMKQKRSNTGSNTGSNKGTGSNTGSNTKVIREGNTVIEVDVERAAKLLMICKSLDRQVSGLGGSHANLLSMVRYGINGPTFASIKARLGFA